MSVPVLLYVMMLVFAIVEQVIDRGRNILAWAVIFGAAGLLWGHFG